MSRFLCANLLAPLSLAGRGGGGGSVQTPPLTPAASTPTFSPAPGTFPAAQSVALSDPTAGAAIHYTTDGSTPTASGASGAHDLYLFFSGGGASGSIANLNWFQFK